MNDQEKKVLELSADLWNAFNMLPIGHVDDKNEFRLHLHAIQNIVMARHAMRSHPELFNGVPEGKFDHTKP